MPPPLQRKSRKYYTFQVCICSLRYPARNAHAPHRHVPSPPSGSKFIHVFSRRPANVGILQFTYSPYEITNYEFPQCVIFSIPLLFHVVTDVRDNKGTQRLLQLYGTHMLCLYICTSIKFTFPCYKPYMERQNHT